MINTGSGNNPINNISNGDDLRAKNLIKVKFDFGFGYINRKDVNKQNVFEKTEKSK